MNHLANIQITLNSLKRVESTCPTSHYVNSHFKEFSRTIFG